MKKVPLICLAGLWLAVVAAAAALAQQTAPPAAEPNQAQQAAVAAQKARDEAFAAQKKLVLQTIARKEFAQAAIESDQLFARFPNHEGLAQAAYDIAVACADVGEASSAREFYDYTIQHWPDSEWAIHSQRDIIHAAIKRKDAAATQAALDKLLTDFAKHKDIAGIVYNLAKHYNSLGDAKIGEKLHVYNVAHYASDKYGLWSQIEIVKAHIADANDPAADAACERLVTTFASDKDLPHVIYGLGVLYTEAKRAERADKFYRYVLDAWPDSPHTAWARLAILDSEGRPESDPAEEEALVALREALGKMGLPARDLYRAAMDLRASRPQRALALHRYNSQHSAGGGQFPFWSQIEVVKALITSGDDAVAEEACNMLMTRYAGETDMPKELYQIADIYMQAGKYDKAEQRYQYIADHWSSKEDRLWAALGRIKLQIAGDAEAEAEAAFENILAEYADYPPFAELALVVPQAYYDRGFRRLTESRTLSKADGDQDTNAERAASGRESLQRAVAAWERLSDLAPTSPATPQALYCAAVCKAQELGDYEGGIQDFEEVLKTWPDYTYAWHAQYLIGLYTAKLTKTTDGPSPYAQVRMEQAYQMVIQNYPDSEAAPFAALRLGEFYLREERWAEAGPCFEHFLQAPNVPPIARLRANALFNLATVYEHLNRGEAAVELYRAFVQMADPTDQRIRAARARLDE